MSEFMSGGESRMDGDEHLSYDREIQKDIDRWEEAYEQESAELHKQGWRQSGDIGGQPPLEREALGTNRQPLPDGTLQTAIFVKNESPTWGIPSWFVKEGRQEAPDPSYEVTVRRAVGGRWIDENPSEEE